MKNKLLSIAPAIMVAFGADVTIGLLFQAKTISTTGVIKHVTARGFTSLA